MNASEPQEPRFQRILFCTDFSESADFAFGFALDATVRRPGAKLYVLHVIHEVEAQFWRSYLYEVENIDAQAKAAIDERIAQAYLSRVPPGLDVQVAIRLGPDAARIVEFAIETGIDLIVMGRQGKSGLHHTLFGNVAEKVVHKAPCAVLLVPLSYREKKTTPTS